jgi:cell division septum initiation protein DivIVA
MYTKVRALADNVNKSAHATADKVTKRARATADNVNKSSCATSDNVSKRARATADKLINYAIILINNESTASFVFTV